MALEDLFLYYAMLCYTDDELDRGIPLARLNPHFWERGGEFDCDKVLGLFVHGEGGGG